MELQLPNRGSIRGLGIRRGVTLIVGGGFHGKSTLLEALQVLASVNICYLDLVHISPGGCVQPCARGWQRICGDRPKCSQGEGGGWEASHKVIFSEQ